MYPQSTRVQRCRLGLARDHGGRVGFARWRRLLGALDALSQPADHPQLLLFIAVAQQRLPTLDQPPESLLITRRGAGSLSLQQRQKPTQVAARLGVLALDHADHPLALMLGDVALDLFRVQTRGRVHGALDGLTCIAAACVEVHHAARVKAELQIDPDRPARRFP